MRRSEPVLGGAKSVRHVRRPVRDTVPAPARSCLLGPLAPDPLFWPTPATRSRFGRSGRSRGRPAPRRLDPRSVDGRLGLSLAPTATPAAKPERETPERPATRGDQWFASAATMNREFAPSLESGVMKAAAISHCRRGRGSYDDGGWAPLVSRCSGWGVRRGRPQPRHDGTVDSRVARLEGSVVAARKCECEGQHQTK